MADRLGYSITERGLRGVRLFATSASAGTVFSLDDPGLERFWSAAERLGVPVDVQVRHPGLDAVERTLRSYPGIPVILDHMSGPALSDGPPYRDASDLFELAAFDQLYLKFSNHNLDAASQGSSTVTAFLEHLPKRFGKDRILWGSIFPNTFGKAPATENTYLHLVDRVVSDVSALGAHVRDSLLGGTALSLYPGLRPTKRLPSDLCLASIPPAARCTSSSRSPARWGPRIFSPPVSTRLSG